MKQQLFAAAVIIGLAALLAGCANFIRDFERTEDRVERTTVGTKYAVRFVPDPPTAAAFPVTALRVDRQRVKKYQVFIKGELVTPYSGWRELYEAPAGLVLIPASLVSHILSLVTFDVYPFSFSGRINDLAFTGLNPCLNWESESRTRERSVTSKCKLVDDAPEDKSFPLPEVAVLVRSGEREKRYTTDKFGTFRLVLVGLDPQECLFNMAREFIFTVGGDRSETRRLLITRAFAGKLLRARAAIVRYDLAPSGKTLVKTVKKLEELKFNELAYALEKRELAKYKTNAAFMKDFSDASLE